jgi:hypothetical protein
LIVPDREGRELRWEIVDEGAGEDGTILRIDDKTDAIGFGRVRLHRLVLVETQTSVLKMKDR